MDKTLQTAHKKMLSLYSESAPCAILSRFYSEKAVLEGRGNYLTFLGLAAKLRDIPASPEDVFDRIGEKLRVHGMTDTGLAYDVAEKTKHGCYKHSGGMEEETRVALLALGFDMDFTFLLEETVYLFPKAQALTYLKEAMAMMWYRCRYPEQYAEIFGSETR